MKIIQITPRYPPHTGGVETHVKQISEELVDIGHELKVITADACQNLANQETSNGVDIERYQGFSPNDAFHFAPAIARAVRRADADIVHAHNYHSLPVFFAALGVSDERFVVTPHYHGASASDFRDRLLSLYQPLGGWALRKSDEIVAVSQWEQEQLREDFDIESTVIPNGIDIERFANAEPEERDRPYLLCVGRLEKYKGVQHVIRALPELADYDLLIAGKGPYRSELEKISEKVGITDRVDFLGYVDEDRLPELYAGADVYVTMSEFEAYGMTVGEALAAGTPCVVRNKGALSDWAEIPGCISVQNDSPEATVYAIHHVDGQIDQDRLHTWREIAERLQSLYREVVFGD